MKSPAAPADGQRHDGVEDPDILRVFLDRVRLLLPEAAQPQLVVVETELRAQYGGLRVRIPKRKKHLTAAQREALYRDALSTSKTDDELVGQHGVSRRTVYRTVKRGVVGRGD